MASDNERADDNVRYVRVAMPRKLLEAGEKVMSELYARQRSEKAGDTRQQTRNRCE